MGNNHKEPDITGRTNAVERLREYERVVESLEEMIVVVDRDYRYLIANRAYLNYRSLETEQVVGHYIQEFLGEETFEKTVKPKLDECFQGRVVEYELRYTYPKLGERDLLCSYFPIEGPGGVDRAACILRDVTERKRAEAESRASHNLLHTVVEGIPDAIFVKDLQGRYQLMNSSGARVLGKSVEEIIGENDSTLISADVGLQIMQRDREVLTTGVSQTFEETITAAGSTRTYVRSKSVLRDSEGNPSGVFGIARDITARKRAEEALREAEDRYRNIFENAGEGIFQTTLEGQYIAANPELARIHGFDSPAELINSRGDISREVYVDPTRRDEFKRLLEKFGVVRGFEHEIFRQDGSRIWISVNARAVRDEQGTTLYFEGTSQDITERKRAEAALRQSEVYFRSLIEHAADTISTYDANGVRLYTSPSIERVLGYKPEEMIGRSGFELLHPDDRPLLSSLFAQAAQIPGTTVTKELRCRHKDGTWRTLESTGSNLLGNPAVGAVVLNSRDITERRRAEAALRESEERYRDLVENSREFICTHDLNGKVLSANRAAAQLLGYDPREFIGQGNVRDLLVPEVRHEFEDYMAKVCKDGATSGLMLVQTKSGEPRVWEYYNSLRTEGVAAPVVRGMARDITEQRRAEESLQLFRNLIDQSSDAIEVIDPITLRFIDCNQSAYRSLGYTREEFLALTVFDIDPLIDPSVMARLDEEMNELGSATLKSIHLRKDGTTFPVEVNVKLVKLERDYRLAVVRDITSRERAETALRLSEERYRELFENARDAIYVHDPSGRYTSVNRAAERLSGFTREEILGKHFSNFVSPRDLKEVRTSLCRKLDDENETVYEVDVVTRSGQRVPVEISSRLIYENGVAVGVQGTARDITDRKRAQEALRIYSQRLIQAQEAEREKIARELHDEIGQVLTAVRINLQAIQRSSEADENIHRFDESIAIVDEALGRVRELSIELRPSLLDDLGLSAALRWYVDRYAQRTGIIAEVLNGFENDRLPRELETVCFRIAQEALTNVARHAHAASVSVQLERLRGKMFLTVADDGVGFDLDNLRKSAPADSALGLRGMEERALAVGGDLEIDSGSGRGTHVRATFPLNEIRR